MRPLLSSAIPLATPCLYFLVYLSLTLTIWFVCCRSLSRSQVPSTVIEPRSLTLEACERRYSARVWWRNPALSRELEPPCEWPSTPDHLRVMFDNDLLAWAMSSESYNGGCVDGGGDRAGGGGGDDGDNGDGLAVVTAVGGVGGVGGRGGRVDAGACEGCSDVCTCDDSPAQRWLNDALQRALDAPVSSGHDDDDGGHTTRSVTNDKNGVPTSTAQPHKHMHADRTANGDVDATDVDRGDRRVTTTTTPNDNGSTEGVSLADATDHTSAGGRGITCANRARAILLNASCVVGMHPDQATEAIVDFALARGLPFAVVRTPHPCLTVLIVRTSRQCLTSVCMSACSPLQ
jgi:hypothetical protein